MFLPNSSSVSWIEGGTRLLYSEIKQGLHMALVTSDQSRGHSRDVYLPPGERSMVHHSYLSPDGRWVLIVQMDSRGDLLPCRVVPFDGSGTVQIVGPPDHRCTNGAWSPDGKWVYLNVQTDASHIWRQRFPGGQPEQVTLGPTSQEGIAIEADGKGIITAVGTRDSNIWLHDADGDHQISLEGSASDPVFSSDGNTLYFLMSRGESLETEVWKKDLKSERAEPLLPNVKIEPPSVGTHNSYSVSADGKLVAFTARDDKGHSSLWVAPSNHRAAPTAILSPFVEDSPSFIPDNQIVFRAVENGANFLYRMKPDGSARTKISGERIFDIQTVSPDGRWVVAMSPGTDPDHTLKSRVFAVDGSKAFDLCQGYCGVNWNASGSLLYVQIKSSEPARALPVQRDTGLPRIPEGGLEQLQGTPGFNKAPAVSKRINSGMSATVYAYTRENTRRNLYRIPIS